jgi:RNA polymerase sigma-70 factor, ECF subfamily
MISENRAQYAWIALRCQANEPGAFEDLIAVMERPLLYYAMALTGSEDGARRASGRLDQSVSRYPEN